MKLLYILLFIHEIIRYTRKSGGIAILAHIQNIYLYSWSSIIYDIEKNYRGQKVGNGKLINTEKKNDRGNVKGRPHLGERGVYRRIKL
jgi:hypothetical protein